MPELEAFSGPHLQHHGYALHARIRAVAVAVTVFLVVLAALMARRLPNEPYSGIILKNLSIARVSRGSPGELAGFKKGDQITSVNGISCSSLPNVSECLSQMHPGDTVLYEVRRAASVLALPITFARPPLAETLRKALLMLVGLSFVAIGLLVYFKRVDKISLVFYLMCLAFGLVLLNIVSFEMFMARHAYQAAFYDLAVLALPALFLHFFLVFPERSPILTRRPRLEYVLYLPAAAFFGVTEFLNTMIFTYGKSYARAIGIFETVTAVYFMSYVILGLAQFMSSYRRAAGTATRRKLRLVVWGTVAGTLPIIAVRLLVSIDPSLEIPGDRFVFLPLLLVPLAFGHAIVRYGLMDLEIVVKRSLVYTVLTAVLAAIYFAVVYGMGRMASRFIGRADLVFSVVSIFVISLLISPLRKRIGASVDKMFFRDEYNYRRVLKQISHSLAGIVDLDNLLSYLAVRIAEVLHSSSIVVSMLDERIDRYTPRYSLGTAVRDLSDFPKNGGLAKLLRAQGQTLNVERTIASSRPLPLPPGEVRALAATDSSLVVPFMFKGSLLGFLSIGRRRAGGFYATTDVELLEILCDQASVAIENARLYVETIEKQRMEKELEIASEIQRRLLPKAFPEIRGLKTYGLNIPSKHVGGDYYDVIPLGSDKVAVIIADVSGKGVPAALLMASLQSSLRAEADADRRPSEVISTLNQTIYEHTSGETFVTIFYGIIDFSRETLTYCSAGQTPPFVMHRDLSVERLDKTDIVLGIESRSTFSDNQLGLKVGDLLFLYTDGVSEELNDQDDPYGEERLVRDLRAAYDLELQALVERVHDAVIRHTCGKPQDDLTALAIRIETFPSLQKSSNLPLF
ncbi:MAG TPA: SpoIIE family protein phosphatase [bacterium]|nr:SpoIIE family protein phosphatase [bacterium]